MGICVKAAQNGDADADLDAASLMAMLGNHVGVEGFQHRQQRLWQSKALQKPPQELTAFRWYSGHFCVFVREQQRAVQRKIVQLYVSGSVDSGGAPLMEDVADHYKQLIKVQDSDLQEVRKENEQLRKEVEAFMLRSQQASSIALAEKMEAMQAENDALHCEVGDLTEELHKQKSQLEAERLRLRVSVSDLEKQLQAVAVGYEQVERQSDILSRENASLQSTLARNKPASGQEAQVKAERDVAAARLQISELQGERDDLYELLGRISATCPEASKIIAPAGASLSS